ncbi:MAG: CARDB domain-containing protein [Promethearchaeota archaeon]
MKKIRKIKRILAVLGLIIIILPISNIYIDMDIKSNQNESKQQENFNLQPSPSYGPIFIDDSDPSRDWDWAATQPWCSGSGTQNDPYIIENVIIDGLNTFNCIEIRNSNVFFIIRHSTVENSATGNPPYDYFAGIKLINVRNGVIFNNTAHHNEVGIYLHESSNNDVIANKAFMNTRVGIYLYTSHNNKISENRANDNDGMGIYLISACNNNEIVNNEANRNIGFRGLQIDGSNNLVLNNVFNRNYVGITLGGGSNIIESNTISYNSRFGIQIGGNNHRIYGNIISNSDDAIYTAWDFDDNIIMENNLYGCIVGINLHDSHRNQITDNYIHNNVNDGIRVHDDCQDNVHRDNVLEECEQYGINSASTSDLYFLNYLMSNNINARDIGTGNRWDDGTIGNYWDDYDGVDANHDGIGDTAYNIPGTAGSKDNYPIFNAYPDFAIFQEDILIESEAGETYVIAAIKNIGFSYKGEIFVRFLDEQPDGSIIQIGLDQIVNGLKKDESKTVSVKWTPMRFHNVSVHIDPDNLITEIDKNNNIAKKGLGGNSPTVGNVWANLGVWDGENSIGTFITRFKVINTFYASISDLDDDVKYVIFTLNGVEYTVTKDDDNIFAFEYNMGSLNPGNNILSIRAHDDLGYASKTRTIIIKTIGLPSWIPPWVIDALDVFMDWNYEDQKYTLEFIYPQTLDAYKIIKKIPSSIPLMGDIQSELDKFWIGFRLEYYINGDFNIWAGGSVEVSICGIPFQFTLTVDIDLDPDLEFESVWIHFQVDLPNIDISGGINLWVVKVSAGVDLGGSVSLDAIIEAAEEGIKLSSLIVEIHLRGTGWVSAKVDIFIAMAKLKASLSSDIRIGFGYEDGNLVAYIIGKPGIRAEYKFTWKIGICPFCIKGKRSGTLTWNFRVGSPEEVNVTTEEEPWSFFEDNSTIADPSPQVAGDNQGNATMIWTANRVEDDANYTDICYSIWNGEDWGPPGYISYDKCVDFDPSLTYDSSGNVIAVWSRIPCGANSYSLEDPYTILKNQEIVFSIWDGSTWSTPDLITNDTIADGRAVVTAGPDSTTLAVWVGDLDGYINTTNDINLYYSVWDGTNWSPRILLTNNAFADYDVSLAHNSEGEIIACWIRDQDGDSATFDDRELRYSKWDGIEWSPSNLVTNLNERKESPSVIFDINDNALITWVGGNENISRLYFANMSKTIGSWSDPEVVYEDEFFIFHPIINVDENNMAVIIWRGFESDKLEQLYYFNNNETETYFDGEICYATKDLTRYDSIWSEVKYLTSDNKTDWMASACIIRGHSNDLLLVWQKEEIVLNIVHEIKPDLSISNSDITFSNQYPKEGDLVDITATVHNIGDVKTKDIHVYFYNGDPNNGGILIGTKFIESLNYDTQIDVTIQWVAESGINNIFVKVDAEESISELKEDNNIAFNVIKILPDLSIVTTDISFSNPNPQEGETITIYATIYNVGGTLAENVHVNFFSNNVLIGSIVIPVLDWNDYTTVSIDWMVTAGFSNISIIVDPENQIVEWYEDNNDAFAMISVLPDFKVKSFMISDDIILIGDSVTLSGEIQNIGHCSADNVLIEFFDGNPYIDGSLINSIIIDLDIGETYTFSLDWTPPMGVHQVFVVIDKLDTIDEINEVNNILYKEIVVKALSDLTISETEIIYTPGLIIINSYVENIGSTGVTGIIVELYDGDPLVNGKPPIYSQTILYIGAGETKVASLKIFRTPANDDLHIIVDPKNLITESDETNNQIIISYSNIFKVDAGLDQEADEGEIIQFSASVFAGNIEDFAFTWDFGDGNTGQGITTSHQYGDNGIYTVILTVTGPGYIATDQLIVTIFNIAPTVNAGLDQTVNEDDVVNFSGSFVDPGFLDTHIIEWDFGDGFSDSGILDPTHSYPNNGLYTVTLKITDDDGGIGTDTMMVTVENVIPIAVAGPNQTIFDDEIVILNASYSWDTPSDLPLLEYLWDFGDGTYDSGKVVSHKYLDLGIYTVTLTVIDDDGASDTDTCFVVVQDDDVEPPELSDLLIVDDIHFVNISIIATDESGIDSFSIYVNGDIIIPIDQIQDGDNYRFVLQNQWILKKGVYEVEIQATDSDNDRINDALTSSIYGTIEITIDEMYSYVDWQLEELIEYIGDHLNYKDGKYIIHKLSKAQERLQEALELIEEGDIICGLYHDLIAKMYVRFSETKIEFLNKKNKIDDEIAEYIISAVHNIRNNIVILMGSSICSPLAYDIALIEVELLNLNDFIEKEISCCTGKYLSNNVYWASTMLEFALFKISMGYSIECILECTQWKLERVIWTINWYLNKGRISEDLANYLNEEITRIIDTIEILLTI